MGKAFEARFGVDLGGTKIEAIVLGENGKELFRKRVPTPQGDYLGTLEAIAGLLEEAERELNLYCSVGVGIPGAISPVTGFVKNANSVCLIGNALDQDLAKRLGRPVRLSNDANCFALSEAVDGAGEGAAIVFGVILGTGVGGGVVIGKQVIGGANAIAGEWGHNPLPWPRKEELDGPDCYCGKKGCLETYLSGPGFAKDYSQKALKEGKDLKGRANQVEKTKNLSTEDTFLNAPEIMALVRAKNPVATQCFELYLDRLARGLVGVINILDPEVIVLGGGMSNIEELYEEIPKIWQNYAFSDSLSTVIRPAIYGDSSGVRGAAWLWDVDSTVDAKKKRVD